MLRLVRRLLARRHPSGEYFCILRFPDSTETRWLSRLPTPGTRLYSHGGRLWVVEEVLQSGRDMYTVFLVGRSEYLRHLHNRSRGRPDLAAELLELARHTGATVTEQRRRRKYRHYLP
jgi:hypothetical protein